MNSTINEQFQWNGFGHAWISDEVGKDSAFLTLFQNRLVDCAKQSLLCDVNTRSNGEHYRLFKSLIEPERYLSVPLSYRFKHCLSNFRSATKYDIFIYFMLVCLQRNVYFLEK